MTTATQTMTVAADKLRPNPYQPRAVLDEAYIRELADSIGDPNIGLLQKPQVRPGKVKGEFELAFGHLRLAAIRLLIQEGKWEGEVPVESRDLTDADMAIIALTENVKRKNLIPIDEYRAWKRALEIEGMTVGKLAESLGLDHSTVSNNIRLLDLPDVVLAKLETGELSPRAAREFLALLNPNHAHVDIMEQIVQDITMTSLGRAPDWRGPNIRHLIHEAVAGRFQEHWRPLADVTGDQDHNGYTGPAVGRRPTFDVEAFKAQFPMAFHQIPLEHGDGNRTWTCDSKEWRRWQSAATRAQNKESEETGTPAPGAKPSDRDAVLSQDPVVKKLVGVSTETVVKEVAGRLAPPTLGEARELAHDIHEYTDAEEADGEEKVAKGYQRVGDLMATALKAKPTQVDDLLEETYIEDVHQRLHLEEAGISLEETSSVIVSLVDNFNQDIAEAAAQPTSMNLTEEQVSAIGTRGQVYKDIGAIKGWKHSIKGPGYPYEDPPSYFHDRPACLKTCTTGAVWIKSRSAASPFLACTNEECFKEKVDTGLKALEEKIQRRRGQVTQEDRTLCAALMAQPIPLPRTFATVLLAHWGIRKVTPDGLTYQEGQGFAYVPACIEKIVELLDLTDLGGPYDVIPKDRALSAIGTADDAVATEVVANLLVYGLRAHDPKAVKALTESLGVEVVLGEEAAPSKEAGPKKARILALHEQGLTTRQIAADVGVRHSYVDKVLKQERERAPA